jgi:hypothetical protein
MKKVVLSLIVGIAIIWIGKHLFDQYTENRLAEQIDQQILVEANRFLDQMTIEFEGKNFWLETETSALWRASDYQDALDSRANVRYGVYQRIQDEDTLFFQGLLSMHVWRENLENPFHVSGLERNDRDVSFIKQIINDFSWQVFYQEDRALIEPFDDFERPEEGAATVSSRSSSTYQEDFELDSWGNVIKPGMLNFESIHYSMQLSMAFQVEEEITDLKNPFSIKLEGLRASGNYHPLWNLEATDVENFDFYKKDEFEHRKTIKDRKIIEELLAYLKSISFDIESEQIMTVDDEAYIQFKNYEHHIILTQDAVYTNSNYAVSYGEEQVQRIIEIVTQ